MFNVAKMLLHNSLGIDVPMAAIYAVGSLVGVGVAGRVLSLFAPLLTKARVDAIITAMVDGPIGSKIRLTSSLIGSMISGVMYGKMGKFGQAFEDNVIQYGIPQLWKRLVWDQLCLGLDKDDKGDR